MAAAHAISLAVSMRIRSIPHIEERGHIPLVYNWNLGGCPGLPKATPYG
jgi:hypothetical protein